jgi:chemotaxis protein methyltransferase CheR
MIFEISRAAEIPARYFLPRPGGICIHNFVTWRISREAEVFAGRLGVGRSIFTVKEEARPFVFEKSKSGFDEPRSDPRRGGRFFSSRTDHPRSFTVNRFSYILVRLGRYLEAPAPMRDSDYDFIRELVYDRSRINLGPDKKELVSARLGKRLRETKITSISEYCRYLQGQESAEELAHLIDAISTNFTFFFREIEHFEFLKTTILPEMTRQRAEKKWKSFNVWSAACASGEEPYSIAISLAEHFGPRPAWDWRIEATDISHRILQRARVGVYREESISKVPPDTLRKHFQRGFGPQDGNYRVKPHILEGVTFRQLNLLEGLAPFPEPFHLIFCRNVMIYFDRATQEELVRRLAQRLVPGGYLYVGHSESLSGIKHSLETVKPAIYRRPLS